ncbi:MAG: Maf family protein, partial [Chloroflexi bacterium]|nr:Maf family protein [Chloroflexota bacterium]
MSEDAPLILASESPRRRELMKALGIDFQVYPAAIDEEKLHREVKNPEELVQKLALAKAQAVFDEHPDSVVLGADTLVCLGSRIFGKP